MKATGIILVSVVLFAATLCFGGESWRYKCESSNCGFEGHLTTGRGFIYKQATGYCTTCREFVAIRWKAEGVTGERKKRQDTSTNLLNKAPDKVALSGIQRPAGWQTYTPAHIAGSPS